MPALKPSQFATALALLAVAVGGVGLPAELAMGHPTFALIWGYAWVLLATAANALSPYFASLGD